jgi:hypothetical protein
MAQWFLFTFDIQTITITDDAWALPRALPRNAAAHAGEIKHLNEPGILSEEGHMADSPHTISAKSETQKCKLTDRFLLALKPAAPGKRRTIWDEVERGLAVRVTDRGAISFTVTRRVKGSPKPVRITIGRYGDVSLADARVQAADLKASTCSAVAADGRRLAPSAGSRSDSTQGCRGICRTRSNHGFSMICGAQQGH